MSNEIITYIHESREVYLTGRIATPNSTSKLGSMVEIVPKGTPVGDRSYAKWVHMDDLLIIQDLETLNEGDDE